MMRYIVQAALGALSALVLTCQAGAQAQPSSGYIRQEAGRKNVIVFAHGVLGDSKSTWDNDGRYWPSMLKDDPAFTGADIYVLGYPSDMWSNLSIDELADNMRLRLSGDGIPGYDRIAFLAHSMGGLVSRSYLLKNRDVAAKTAFMYFLSTPTTGSQVAKIATLVSRNPMFSKMKPMNAEDFLADLLRQWLAADFKIPSYCAYEKRATYGMMIVDFQSASALCNKALDPLDESHISIAKPASSNADAYYAFKAAFTKELGPFRPKEALVRQFQTVLNTLQMTQISRSEFLFPQMESYIQEPSESKWREIRATARRIAVEIQDAVSATMQFDAQFFQAGGQVLLVNNGVNEVVDRSFYRPFRVSRQTRASNAPILRDIEEMRDLPTGEQVQAWSNDLKQRYATIEAEMQRLLALIQSKG